MLTTTLVVCNKQNLRYDSTMMVLNSWTIILVYTMIVYDSPDDASPKYVTYMRCLNCLLYERSNKVYRDVERKGKDQYMVFLLCFVLEKYAFSLV